MCLNTRSGICVGITIKNRLLKSNAFEVIQNIQDYILINEHNVSAQTIKDVFSLYLSLSINSTSFVSMPHRLPHTFPWYEPQFARPSSLRLLHSICSL